MTVVIHYLHGSKYEYVCNYFTIDSEKGFLFQIGNHEPICLCRDGIKSFEVFEVP